MKPLAMLALFVLSPIVVMMAPPARGAPLDAVEADRIRIRAHLEEVERELRAVDATSLPPAHQRQRARNIERLRAYRDAGVFPRNDGHPGERRPYFIDSHDRVCAVGALMFASGDAALARRIAAKQNNARVREMKVPGLGTWLANSGLTIAEAARIQPEYCEDGLCQNGEAPACGASGESYLCRDLLEQCSDDTFVSEGECPYEGPPEAGEDPPLEQSPTHQRIEGCSLPTGPAAPPHGLLTIVLGAVALWWRRQEAAA